MTSPAAPVHNTYEEALKRLQSPAFIDGPKFREQQNRANRKGANIDIITFERAFIRRLEKLKVPMFAHNMVRTEEEQTALYIKGVSKAKGAQGPHVHGCAVDIVHSTRAWDLTKKEWTLLGHIGKEVAGQLGIKLTWGGDWKFYDPAHWEIANWRDLPHVQTG